MSKRQRAASPAKWPKATSPFKFKGPRAKSLTQNSTQFGNSIITDDSNEIPINTPAPTSGGRPGKRESSVRLLRADAELLQAEVVVVVLGPTGAGKSRFIREAGIEDVEVGDSLQSVTKQIRPYHLKINSRHIALVDTPGFDDTYRPDAEIFKELAIWLAARYQSQSRLTAILYMQPITATRMGGSALRNLMTMKKMLGVQSFPQLTLVTSMWDVVDAANAESREKDLIENYWHDLIGEGAAVARSYGDRPSAHRVLETIKLADINLSLTIQQELVDENLPLERTSAGTFLGHEFRRLANAENDKLQRNGQRSAEVTDDLPVQSGKQKGDPHSPSSQSLAELQRNLKELRVLDNTAVADAGSLYLAGDVAQLPQALRERTPKEKLLSDLNATVDSDYSSLFLVPDPQPTTDAKQSIYESLAGDDFRLVHLRAGQGTMPIELSLTIANLDHPPQYAALSYVVGQGHESAFVNFRRNYHVFPIEISENLETALRCLRRPYRDIHLWIDALSVNQFDLEERAREVRRMSRLFQSASNVCIWLGPASLDVKLALEFIPEILDFASLEDLVNDASRKQSWLGLAKLMSRSYFRRRWIVQEILLSRAATVHCGDHVVSWQDFVDVAVLLRSKWSELQQTLVLSDEEILELGDAQMLGAASLIEVSRLIFRKDHRGKILQRLLNLETLLSLLPTFEVTELHDTVYAVIDLANDAATSSELRVDYGWQPEELFQEVTRMVIQSSNSLDIICRPWAPKCGLPSWIPTIAKYTFRRRALDFQYDRQQGVSFVEMPQSRMYRACDQTTPEGNVSFRTKGDQRILSVQGFVLGSVDDLGQRSMNGNIPREWMDLGGWANMTRPVPGPFWRTLVTNRGIGGAAVPEWYGRACQFAFRKSTHDDIDTTFLMKTLKSTHVHEFLGRVQEVVWGRTFASIDPGNQGRHHLALCPPDARTEDLAIILHGCSVPVLLRKVRSYYKLIGELFIYGMMDGEAFIGRTASSPTVTFELI